MVAPVPHSNAIRGISCQIIHAHMDKTAGNKVTHETGALEHPKRSRFAIDVLEGGRTPFDKRDDTN